MFMEKPIMSVLLPITFLCLFLISPIISFGSFNSACIPTEREALLQFKHGLSDPSNRLQSWGAQTDCCQWYGVICSNLTGHVLELHLRSLSLEDYDQEYGSYYEYIFGGKISSCLLNLKELRYFDLSNNDFGRIQIPKFLGSLWSLRVLNLSSAGFGGLIPHELGNLSNLHYLNLKDMFYCDKYADSLHWLSGLSMLEYLDMSYVNLSQSIHWVETMNHLPSLVELHLSHSNLVHIPALVHVNFSSISVLDLSENSFPKSLIPNWVFRLKTLKFLNLASSCLKGPVHTHLQNMTSLQRLDLSSNWLSFVPKWILSLRTLLSLNLASNGFQGSVHAHPQNMTSLQRLDLSSNQFSLVPKWVLSLRTLLSLNLGNNAIEGPIPNELQNLSSIEELNLSFNGLNSSIPNLLYNFRHLKLLDLRSNFLEGKISNAIGNMTSLTSLDLSFNEFDGGIPKSFKNLCNLRTLSLGFVNLSQDVSDILEIQSGCVSNELQSMDLHGCNLFGQLSNRLGNFNKLTILDLSNNSISGPIPLELGALANLDGINISHNSLEGNIFENHFANLSKLIVFDGYMNRLILRVSSVWIPPFIHLEFLRLSGWDVGSQFPSWVGLLKDLNYLDLSNSRISGFIPNWFWNSSRSYSYLNLSHNQIHGVIPDIDVYSNEVKVIDLSSNHIEGSLTPISYNVRFIDFSNNSLSGSLSHFLCYEMDGAKKMKFMHLSNNFLFGKIPDCWSAWPSLESIRLSNNNFSGNIPKSIGNLRYLTFLHLRNNSLSGEIPLSLQNCKYLTLLDLGENKLMGHIPTWIGKWFVFMSILSLRENELNGDIPKELCQLEYLSILDLSHNFLSGNIPNCISNFRSMATGTDHRNFVDLTSFRDISLSFRTYARTADDQFYSYVGSFHNIKLNFREDAMIVMKGRLFEYENLLKYVRSLDLSSNNLSGEIPREITTLQALQSLNLSNNFLSGKIPEQMGDMSEAEALDLSQNLLCGKIPQSITELTFLSMLNLSHNKLSGRIPTGTQLQSFDSSSFIGNEGLCGPPLSDNCSSKGVVPGAENGTGEGDEVDWILYVSISLGFIVGFWSILCPLFINRRWRHTFYGFLDRLWNRVWCSFRCL